MGTSQTHLFRWRALTTCTQHYSCIPCNLLILNYKNRWNKLNIYIYLRQLFCLIDKNDFSGNKIIGGNSNEKFNKKNLDRLRGDDTQSNEMTKLKVY